MNSIEQVKTIQEIFLNSWPAKGYYFLNGWILRYNEGITDRANAVIPLNYTGNNLDDDIDEVERIYEKMNLKPSFMIHDYHEPKNLKSSLISRGYHVITPTKVMISSVQDLTFPTIESNYDYNFCDKREREFSKFVIEFTHWTKDEQEIISNLTNRIIIPDKLFEIVRYNGLVIASMMGVLVRKRYLYIADVLVHPNFRRKHIASTMLYRLLQEWTYKKGAKIVWLQVEEDNENAFNLYKNLGMNPIFEYSYLKKYN